MKKKFRIWVVSLFVITRFIHATPSDLSNEQRLIKRVEDALEKAERGESKLSQAVLSLEGMSGAKTRHLLNCLCSEPSVNYLEIGCWKGSTLISALYGNQVQATVIDNWSQFDNQRDVFYSNVSQFIPNSNLNIYEKDCFLVDKATIPPKVNVYFYDGDHTKNSQKLAFTYFDDVFDDVFIAVIDDWNWRQVKRGTFTAFEKLNYTILFEKVLLTDHPNLETWWNGIYIAVIKKSGNIPGVIEKSEIGQGGSSDFSAGTRDIAKGKDRSEDEKDEAQDDG